MEWSFFLYILYFFLIM